MVTANCKGSYDHYDVNLNGIPAAIVAPDLPCLSIRGEDGTQRAIACALCESHDLKLMAYSIALKPLAPLDGRSATAACKPALSLPTVKEAKLSPVKADSGFLQQDAPSLSQPLAWMGGHGCTPSSKP